MPGTTRLALYNKVMRYVGERRLASLTEAREPRYVLDDVYTSGISYCLEQGFWNHAMRTAQFDSSESIEPTIGGYDFAFAKPSDWVRTFQISMDSGFSFPLLQYVDEAQYWYASFDPLYVQYVSNDTGYGFDLTLWPETFIEYVAAHLAFTIAPPILKSEEKLDRLEKTVKRLRIDARAKDAMNEPVKFPPRGTWVRSRNFGNPNRSLWSRD